LTFTGTPLKPGPTLERFQAKWKPVRVKKTRQIKNLEPCFDSIETEKALVLAAWQVPMDHAVPILVIALVVAVVVVFYITGRAWRRRHTYDEDFWRRGGW
jgi:hypothetical protein